MATFMSFLKKQSSMTQDVRNPFCVTLSSDVFVNALLEIIWARVLQNTLRRCIFKATNSNEIIRSWGFSSQNGKGLVEYVAEAMADCSEVALAFEDSVLRKMTSDEEKTFIAGGKIAKGKIILDFTGFKKSVIAKFYLNQLFLINQTRSTQWGIAGALIFRLKGIRELVANGRVFDKEASSKVTDSVKKGGTAEIDADDKIGGTDSVNSDIITQGRASIISDMAFAMDLTTSMLTREITTGGLSVDAEADIMAEAEVLEFYYYSICEPVINQLYGVSNVTYRADRWRSLESRLRALSMLEASEFWQKKSDEEKIKVWDELLGFQDTNSSSQ